MILDLKLTGPLTPENAAECWRDWPGYEGRYQVSNLGRTRSLDRVLPDGRRWRGRILRPYTEPQTGYRTVKPGGNARNTRIHELVMLAFAGARPPGEFVLHGRAGSAYDFLGNLRYGPPKENNADMILDGHSTRGERHHNAKLSGEQVREIRRRWRAGEMQRDLMLAFGMSQSQMSAICNGTRWGWLDG